MSRNVKGVLFADYVRMIRGNKSVDWKAHLLEEDLVHLASRIPPDAWYPMATFERLGNAILTELGFGDVETARLWGRASVDQLRAKTPLLVAPGDPFETMMRFRVLRATFFDFPALDVEVATTDQASLCIHYYMGPLAEEAASYQTMGFFERLLVIAGAEAIKASFAERSWAGDATTRLELEWRLPSTAK